MKMKNKIITIFLAITLIISLATFVACEAEKEAPTPAPTPTPTPPAPAIELKAVGFQSPQELSMAPFIEFIDIVNEKAKGELVINLLGGAEVIEMAEQAMALNKGTIDLGFLPMAQVRGFLPWGKVIELSELTVMEERESGAYDFMVDQLKQKNLFFLGRGTLSYPNSQYYIFLTKKVTTPQQMAGLQIGPGTLAIPFLKKLGAKPVRIRDHEAYTSMERGVEDGHINVPYSAVNRQWYEVAPYVINHPLYASTIIMLANLDSWNRLPKHLQDLMMQVKIEREPYWLDELNKWNIEAIRVMEEKGVEFIEFSPADVEWWYENANQVAWDSYMESDPENCGKIKPLITK